MAIEVRLAGTATEVAEAMALRQRVFCGEQGVSLEAERDGRDDEALHVVAYEDGRLVGTCRLLLTGDEAKLGRMAVEGSARGRGVGRAVLRAAERSVAERGGRRVKLHAQRSVESLYARAGYSAYGEPFVEEGIDHVAMRKDLGGGGASGA